MNRQPINDPEIEARKAEIAETRERLVSEVQELRDRVSPENVAQVAKEKAKEMAQEATKAVTDGMKQAAHDTKDKVKGAAIRARDGAIDGAYGFGRTLRDNPVPAALTAAGIGYLVYRAVSESREGIGELESSAGRERGEREGAYGVPSYDERWGTNLPPWRRNGSGNDLARFGSDDEDEGKLDGLRDAGHRAKDRASELADRVIEGSRRGGRKARDETRAAFIKQPLIFGLGAFVAGLALAAMVPSTDREDELMGEHRDRFLREAKSRAQDAGAVAKEAARMAVEHVDRQLPSEDELVSKDDGPTFG